MAARNATTRCFVLVKVVSLLADWIGKSTHMTAVMLIGIFAYTERCRESMCDDSTPLPALLLDQGSSPSSLIQPTPTLPCTSGYARRKMLQAFGITRARSLSAQTVSLRALQ